MRFLVIGAALVAMSAAATAQTRVGGYVRQNGTYVAPHYRTTPNSSIYDNYSTRPNVNPYTGQTGTRTPNPYRTPALPRPRRY